MASQSEKDAATKTRIITHMNADHQDSLIHYLQHHAHLSSFSARNAHLTDIAFSHLTITSSPSHAHFIPISPPMTAWSEARPRVVAMDKEACAALGISSITMKKYKAPYGFMTVVMAAVVLTIFIFVRRANFEKGSWCYDYLLRYVQEFAAWAWKVQPLVWWPMVVLHVGEAVYMWRSRLEKHTVRMGGVVWWKWVVSTFFEGYGAFIRFDEVVREEEERRAAAKH